MKWHSLSSEHVRRRLGIVVAAVLSAAPVVSCAGPPAPEPQPVHASVGTGHPLTLSSCGFSSTIAAAPRRAVTLNQGATEILLALGLESHMAGTAYLDDAVSAELESAYARVPVIAAQYPSTEALTAVRPDFVYASYASAFDDKVAGAQSALAAAGIGSYLSPFGCQVKAQRATPSFDAVWREISSVAAAFGVGERAATLLARQRGTLEELARTAAGRGRTLLWLDEAGRTPTVGAGGGGPQMVISAVGATNVYADAAGGWVDGSWEAIVAADPDVIVLVDADWDPAAAKLGFLQGDPVLSTLRAVRGMQIAIVPFSESTPGVRLVEGARKLSDQLGALDPSP